MTLVLAVIGAKALYLTYVWLLSTIVASYITSRKGYGEKPGLAAGLLLTFVGVIVVLLLPAKSDSAWKLQGPIARRGQRTVAELRAEHEHEHEPGA